MVADEKNNKSANQYQLQEGPWIVANQITLRPSRLIFKTEENEITC